MIKINLLLARKEKKKVGIRKEFIVLIGSIVVLLVVLGLIQWRLGKEKEYTQAKIVETRQEINRYKSLTTELNKHKEAQKDLQDKLNVINALRKEKASPAKVLDELSIVKPEKMQLESLKKEGSKLGIEGIALDDETIANFMTNLRKSKLFKNVDLIVSEQIEQSKIKLKKFILSCEIILT
ncbi:MAG: fimbrial protein [Deltaproteobacteria bacterium CG_4_8_14_3_um_filter_45_9]|jgi:type IV pilus assembly protein PilN|nr:MAG: fimbrial protein [Deltaproteobacteria bacterium CG03_land_8_20_14_0_80_45_14]PIX22786.1 MAG: fimbrial protein [Deltaproteobacteria bacterium CG_4_8_14_3_um_filter_45_9]